MGFIASALSLSLALILIAKDKWTKFIAFYGTPLAAGVLLIAFRDPVVERVVDKFVKRSDVGYEKYGRTLDHERRGKHKDLAGYLNDIQEELMDAVLYIQAAREELQDLSEESLIQRCIDDDVEEIL